MVSLSLSHKQSGFMLLGVDPSPDVNEIFFTFIHIHMDTGKVTRVNKNETATKIHPQGPRPTLGLSVKTKNIQLIIVIMIPPSSSSLFTDHLGLAILHEFPIYSF